MTREPPQGGDRLGGEPGRSPWVTGDWEASFAAVPRSAFLPDLMWPHDLATGRGVPVRRSEDPERWRRAACADIPIVTQWDDGRHRGTEPGAMPTSSASQPSVVAGMLRDLDVSPGARVLEIGTGTGWNAGLLAHRLGDVNVTTVEVDGNVARAARQALRRAGFRPTVIHADGVLGHAAGAPFDRVVATAGVRRVPPAWTAQCRPGAVVLAPWGTHFSHQEALLRLTVGADGAATGPFLRPLAFMTLRRQRLDWGRFNGHVPRDYTEAADRSTASVSRDRAAFPTADAAFALGLRVPRCARTVNVAETGETRVWCFDLDSRSWAVAVYADDSGADVHQAGPRRLWDEVEAAVRWWEAAGCPGVSRFGLTVLRDGAQRPWLDTPAGVLPARW